MRNAVSFIKNMKKKALICSIATLSILGASNAKANLYEEAKLYDYDGYWILVDSINNSLKLYNNYNIVKEFHASIGSNGASFIRTMGDRRTPIGDFKIDHYNPYSQFRKFFRINYPQPKHVEQALAENIISEREYREYWRYKRTRGYPPQLTKLGGNIGIHGVGRRDPWLHQRVDWTEGCVAVNNSEIEELSRYIGVGTRVLII
jgi:murein L,D-transpeptidase YafK